MGGRGAKARGCDARAGSPVRVCGAGETSTDMTRRPRAWAIPGGEQLSSGTLADVKDVSIVVPVMRMNELHGIWK